MKRQSTYLSASPAETERIAAEIAADVRPGDYIALFGEMGAGKTAFTRGLIAALAPECLPLVHSPTFAIVNEYRGGNVTVYHFEDDAAPVIYSFTQDIPVGIYPGLTIKINDLL